MSLQCTFRVTLVSMETLIRLTLARPISGALSGLGLGFLTPNLIALAVLTLVVLALAVLCTPRHTAVLNLLPLFVTSSASLQPVEARPTSDVSSTLPYSKPPLRSCDRLTISNNISSIKWEIKIDGRFRPFARHHRQWKDGHSPPCSLLCPLPFIRFH